MSTLPAMQYSRSQATKTPKQAREFPATMNQIQQSGMKQMAITLFWQQCSSPCSGNNAVSLQGFPEALKGLRSQDQSRLDAILANS
jgi:hypothetical protein